MKFAKLIDYSDLRKLLESESVREIDQEIANAQKLKLIPNETITHIQKDLSAADLTLDRATELLKNEKKDIKEYCLAIVENEQIQKDADLQEYPEGEEPDEDDLDEIEETLGVIRGVSLLHLCTYHCLKNRSYDDLKDFVKWKRIPYSKKYASLLRKVFKNTSGKTGIKGKKKK